MPLGPGGDPSPTPASDASALRRSPSRTPSHKPVEETLTDDDRSPRHLPIEQGAYIDRYVVLHRLGSGAMGVVVAAYDPDLDRKVAIKLLKPRDGSRLIARERLQREAQALAMLSHPNVVAVQRVGVHEGSVFLAMELVSGRTLRAWLRDGGGARPWQDVVRVFEDAGRGLAAVHERGLVHRDFKPDNVMIDEDPRCAVGRVRVMDFGLARALDDRHHTPDAEEGPPSGSGDSLRTPLTRTGAVIGTPAYMAPEQFAGVEASARSDQFAYCVSFHEALYGVRPFDGEDVATLAATVLGGEVQLGRRKNEVPEWVKKIVLRGLSAAPDDRYPTMSDLLADLAAGPQRGRLAWFAAGGTVLVAAAVAGAAVYDHHALSQRIAACSEAGAEIEQVWNEAARDELRSGLVATQASYASSVADKIVPWLDAHGNAWRTAATQACTNATIDRAWSEQQLDKAQWCLEERRLELASFLEQSAADADAVRFAVQGAADLASPAACADEAVLAASPDPPPAWLRPQVLPLRRDLSRAVALSAAGKYDDAITIARQVERAAAAVRAPVLQSAAGARLAASLRHRGEYAEAEAVGTAAYLGAVDAGAWAVAAHVASDLADVVGNRRARHEDGLGWARHAEAAIERSGDEAGLREAHRLHCLAFVRKAMGELGEAEGLLEQAATMSEAALGLEHPRVAAILHDVGDVIAAAGRFDEARARHEQALSIRLSVLGPDHPDVGASLASLAAVHYQKGEHEAARDRYERALAILVDALGEHPSVAQTLGNLANVYEATGAYDEAEVRHRRALAIHEKLLGSAHPEVATSLNNLGMVHAMAGDHDEAAAQLQRALAIWEEVLGPDHPDLGFTLGNLGSLYAETGEHARARTYYERALEIWEKALGGEHPRVAMVLGNLANLHAELHEYAESKALFERALGLEERSLGPEHPHVAWTLTGLGNALVGLGEHQRGIDALERAVAIQQARDTVPESLAESRFALARALWNAPASVGRDRVRARTLAEQAHQAYLDGGATTAASAADTAAWLAEHSVAPGRG